MLKNIWMKLKDRVSYIIELRIYEKEKRFQTLFHTSFEEKLKLERKRHRALDLLE